MTLNEYERIATKLPSNIYGIKWIPSLEPSISSDTDWVPATGWQQPLRHISEMNASELTKAFMSIKKPRLMVEIGVGVGEDSSTKVLSAIKPKDCVFVGIDTSLRPVPQVENYHFLHGDSSDREKLYALMRQLDRKTIDFMFVDGWHSINQVLRDWLYWERMSQDGIMVFHDTNFHPGPVMVLAAIDESIFSVEYFGAGACDWGLGAVKRRTT
jgi:cephalosporin hydroxylase